MIHRNVRGGVPSPYPRFLFHGLRSAQLLASIVVSGIMAYFMYYLRQENIAVPWTFIVLMAVSLATILVLTITIILYNFTYLSPKFNLILNGGISLFWAMGLGLLSWSVSTSHVLAKQCTGNVWGGEAEAGVCRDYKALWAMTLVGTASTFAALTLDLTTQRKVTYLGAYNKPEDDKDAQKLNDLKSTRVRSAGYDAPMEQGGAASHVRVNDGVWRDEHLQGDETAYHNRYGAVEDEDLVHAQGGIRGDGPLEDLRSRSMERRGDVGYGGGGFRD